MEYNNENQVPSSRERVSATITVSSRDIGCFVVDAVTQALDGKAILPLAAVQQILDESAAKISAMVEGRVNAAIDRLSEDFADELCKAIEASNKKRLETTPTIENHGLVSRAEAEKILRSSYATVYKLLRNGVLDPVYISRKVYFHREQVEEVLRSGVTGGKRRTRARNRAAEPAQSANHED